GFNFSYREPHWGTNNPHPNTPVDPVTGQPHELGLPASVVDASGNPLFDEVTDSLGQTRLVPVTDLSRGQPLYRQTAEGLEPVVLDPENLDGNTIEQINGVNVLTSGNALSQQRVIDPNTIQFNGWTGSSGN